MTNEEKEIKLRQLSDVEDYYERKLTDLRRQKKESEEYNNGKTPEDKSLRLIRLDEDIANCLVLIGVLRDYINGLTN